MFKDREEAGKKLSALLDKYRGTNAIVCALPKGGVVVGYEIASRLGLVLELALVKKIGHPENPEYAIGAVGESGKYTLNDQDVVSNEEWLAAEIKKAQVEIQERKEKYYVGHKETALQDKTVIVTDDGAATGLSLLLAIHEIRLKGAKKIVVAMPVMPQNIMDAANTVADEMVVIESPDSFLGSVGDYYFDFKQLTDDDVLNLLAKSWQKK